jgi:hypothetical protein
MPGPVATQNYQYYARKMEAVPHHPTTNADFVEDIKKRAKIEIQPVLKSNIL